MTPAEELQVAAIRGDVAAHRGTGCRVCLRSIRFLLELVESQEDAQADVLELEGKLCLMSDAAKSAHVHNDWCKFPAGGPWYSCNCSQRRLTEAISATQATVDEFVERIRAEQRAETQRLADPLVREDEREACAQVAERLAEREEGYLADHGKDIAAAIRARGAKP